MFQELFGGLTRAVGGNPAAAVSAALAWGVLSIVLSPCHLASIPLIVGFIGERGGEVTARRATGLATSFAVGILLSIAGVGTVTALAGRMAGDVGPWVNYALAGVLFLMGLHLLGVVSLPLDGFGAKPERRGGGGAWAAFLLGAVFGVALGPCTFAFMAPVLAVVFRAAQAGWGYAMLLLLAYGVGHCGVIVLAGSSTGLVQQYLAWGERSRGIKVVKKVCGVLVLIGGLNLIYTA